MDPTQQANRIAVLERQLVQVEQELIALHQSEMVAEPLSASPSPPPPLPPPPPPPPPQDSAPSGDTRRYAGVELLLRLGGITLVVLAVVFFVSTAISRGWIGPSAQLGLATVASLGIIVQSFRFGELRRPWAVTFAAGGATALFASGVVGYVGLELLSFPVALGWLTGSIAVFLALSRTHRSELLALLSAPAMAIGAGLLEQTEVFEPELLALVGGLYVAGLVLTTLGQRWYVARSLGVGLGALLAMVGLLASNPDTSSLGPIVALTILAIVGVIAAAVAQAFEFDSAEEHEPEGEPGHMQRTLQTFEARLAAFVIPWIAITITGVVEQFAGSPWNIGWTLASVGVVCGLPVTAIRRHGAETMIVLHQLASIGVIAVGSAFVFDGPALLVALLSQAVCALYLAARSRSLEMAGLAGVLWIAVALMTLRLVAIGSLVDQLSLAEIAGSGLVVAIVAGLSWRYRSLTQDGMLWIVGWLAILGWITVARLLFPQGDMIVSLLWAGLGTAMVVLGAHLRDNPIVWGGLCTLAVTAAKLFLIDLASVDVLWRAGLFMVVGAVFLRLGFVVPALLERGSIGRTSTPTVDSWQSIEQEE